jgi:hypothetical protein
MPIKVLREPRELGCPVSELVRKVLGSGADFQTIGQFGSAVGRTKEEILSECPPLVDFLVLIGTDPSLLV